MKQNAFYSALALNHIAKNSEMKKDFANILAKNGETMTVDQLLNMSVEDFIKTNANEVMTTGQTGFGKEFVEEVVLSTELIERLKTSGNLLAKAIIRQMTARKMSFPVRGGTLRMVSVSENPDLPEIKNAKGQVKKAVTASIELEAKTFAITLYFSDELLEDSVINMANYIMTEITEAYAITLHQIIINGDVATGANTNINIIDENTTALINGDNTDILKFDGARKLAITKNATIDAGANLGIENIRLARAKMGVKGLNPADLVLVPDMDTYFALMNLTEVETIEKFGDAATIKNGVLAALDGITIEMREEMVRANAEGKISKTSNNNVKGQILLIHTPSLNIGIRRGLTTETSRYGELMTTGVTGSARFAVKFNDVQNNAQPTSPVALIINI